MTTKANVDSKKDATSLADFSSYKKVRARTKAVLDVLWQQPDHRIYDKSGRATSVLIDLLPQELLPGSISAFTMMVREMEEPGFVVRETKGKRTFAIAVGKHPSDWTPPEVVVIEAGPPSNGEVAHTDEEEEVRADLIEPTEPTMESEARDNGIRPGRLAARLERMERTIPALVEEGVVAGINGWFTQIAVALGYNKQEADNSEVEVLSRTLAELESELENVTSDLRQERMSNIAAREELNRVLRTTVASRETSPVRPSELQEQYRGLASHAIHHGWTLHRTNGGHIMWKSPTGERYFTASTSSDWRAVRNARSDMERMGLPKE